MQKEVILFLGSVQTGGMVGGDRMEVITTGQYFLKNKKHYIIYEETLEGGGASAKNIIKIGAEKAEVIKSGPASVHMVFEKQKKNCTYYELPHGKLMVGLETTAMELEEEPDKISLHLEYRLEMDDQHVADCVVDIRAESKDTCKMNLMEE